MSSSSATVSARSLRSNWRVRCAVPDYNHVTCLCRHAGRPISRRPSRSSILGRMWLPVVRADLRMNETYSYTPTPGLDCPITAFAGEYDRTVSVECVDGWRRHTMREFRLIPLLTGHFWTPKSSTDALVILSRVLRGLHDTAPEAAAGGGPFV